MHIGDYIEPSSNNRNSIHHNKEDSNIRFYIAGYTKSVQGVGVQSNHLYLYTDSIIDRREKRETDPLPMTSIILEKESDNKYDPNAIIVSAIHPKNIEKHILNLDKTMATFVLGYVPAEISKLLTDNFHLLEPGYIRRFIATQRKDKSSKVSIYTTVKTSIVIPYKQQEIKHSIFLFPNRIRDIEL